MSSQRYGALPPVALSSIVSGTATSATWFGGAAISRPEATAREIGRCELAPPADTFAVKDAVPGAIGVPLNTPLDASERPAGNDPAAIVQLLVPEPPEAERVVEYASPTVATARLEVVIASAGVGVGTGPPPPEPLIVIVNWRCAFDGTHQLAEGGFSSLRLTLDASVNPGGSDPPIKLNW